MYSLENRDAGIDKQVAALPTYEAVVAYAQVRAVLELRPDAGDPLNELNPDGPMRTFTFGAAGMVTYLIIEHARRVIVLSVVWVG